MKKRDEIIVLAKTLVILSIVGFLIYLITLNPTTGLGFTGGFIISLIIYIIVRNEYKRKHNIR